MEFPAPTPYTPTPSKPNSSCFLNPDTTSLTLSLASKYFFVKTGDYASFINSSLYQLDGTVIQTQYLTNITIGTSIASKCLVMDATNKITINDITTPTLTITGNSTLSGTNSVLSLSGANSYLTLTNTQASTNITSGAIRCSGGAYFNNDCVFATQASFGSSVMNQTTAGYLTSISPGTASASKALVIDVNRDISNIRNLTANNLTGTIQTASQTNITSVGTLTGLTVNGSTINSITDSGVATLVYPLSISHLLSSGIPNNNSFGIGMLLNGPNASSTTVSYGRIYSTCQLNTAGVHQGSLTLSSVIGGAFADVMTISSLTSSTNNLVAINGSTSLLSVYNINNKIQTISNVSANPSLNITCTSTQLGQINYISDGTTWETGVRGSASGSGNATGNCFYWANGAFHMSITPAGIINWYNASVSTTPASNAFQIAGGLYTGKAVLNNSYYNCNTNNLSATSYSVSTQAICLNSQAIYFRGQNGSDTNHGLMYSGNGYANWNSTNGFGNSSVYKTDGPVLYGNAGVMIGNLNSAATQTICATFVGTTTSLLGKVNINGPTTTTGQLNIQSFGQPLNFSYDASHNGYFSFLSDSRLSFTSQTTAGNVLQYWFDSYDYSTVPRLSLSGNGPKVGTDLGGSTGQFRLDFGATAADHIIVLFNTNNLNPTYSIGANNAQLLLNSAGSNGHAFYNSSGLSGVGAQTNKGTLMATIDAGGNVIAQSGIHAYGFSSSGLGTGAHMHYAASTAAFFGYNYGGSAYTDMSLGNNNIFIKASNGFVGINQTNPTCPLHVQGTGNQTTASSFGWLSGAGTGTATGFTGRPFSIRCSGGIMCDSGEIDVLSDEYFKDNIIEISNHLANDFITKINPISFCYKQTTKPHYGYSAQDLIKNHFNVLVGCTPTDEPLDERKLVNDDGEICIIPKDTRLVVSPIEIIPLLHKAMQLLTKKIIALELELERRRSVAIGKEPEVPGAPTEHPARASSSMKLPEEAELSPIAGAVRQLTDLKALPNRNQRSKKRITLR